MLADMVDMYQEGKSTKQIATHFNHPYQRVYERLKAFYGVASLGGDERTKETRTAHRAEREKEEVEWFRKLLDDDTNDLVRMKDKYPPLKDGEVKAKVVDNFIEFWNNRNKGVWDRKLHKTVKPDQITFTSMCELNGLTKEQGKRILFNDERVKQ